MRIPSNNILHHFLSLDTSQNEKIRNICKLHSIPDRRTFDRRFLIIPLREIIANMSNVFLSEKLVDCTTASIDFSLLKAKGSYQLHSCNIPSIGMSMCKPAQMISNDQILMENPRIVKKMLYCQIKN